MSRGMGDKRLSDAAEPGHRLETEIIALRAQIKKQGRAAADTRAEVVDRVVEITTAAQRAAAERERVARKARLQR